MLAQGISVDIQITLLHACVLADGMIWESGYAYY